jgi:hypothetical protein
MGARATGSAAQVGRARSCSTRCTFGGWCARPRVRQDAVREVHGAVADVDAALDRLADVVVALYDPLSAKSLSMVVRRLRYGVPQWADRMTSLLARTTTRLASAQLQGVRGYWPAETDPTHPQATDDDATLRLLAPFDPIV